MNLATAEWLAIAGDRSAWAALGLTIADDGTIPLFGTSLRLVDARDHPVGLAGWALAGVADPESAVADLAAEGLPTEVVEPVPPRYADHELGATALDHVVVLTPDLERTSGVIAAATGHELRRIREMGTMRQGFHRIGRGGLIVELVERAEMEAGPASFWGIVLIVDDLDVACARIGHDLVSEPKDAVQAGRRIATLCESAGLGLPVALMTPDR